MSAVKSGPDRNGQKPSPYRLACLGARPGPTTVHVPNTPLTFGGESVGVIAGPCSVEGHDQLMDIARLVKAAGATGLRGGAFKPRTGPSGLRGLGEKGLEMLAEAGRATGLAVVTEVMAPEQVGLVARFADVLQIGARNMQNYPLLEAAGAAGKPVLLKRGPSATMDEFLFAAEYVLRTGNPDVILCERGIRTFEDHVRFTLPLASVPYLKSKTHLPVVIDPSHGTGKAELVAPMARAAVAVGADGLMVEVHADPDRALSDGHQALTPEVFLEMMAECRRAATACDRTLAE